MSGSTVGEREHWLSNSLGLIGQGDRFAGNRGDNPRKRSWPLKTRGRPRKNEIGPRKQPRDLCVARASKVTCVFLMSRWSWIVEIQRCNKNIIKDVTCLFRFSDQTFSRWIEFSLKCSVRIIIGNQFLFTNFCCYKINFSDCAVHRTIKVTHSALFS